MLLELKGTWYLGNANGIEVFKKIIFEECSFLFFLIIQR